jgi:DNA-binding GntR family transcriptional regulator
LYRQLADVLADGIRRGRFVVGSKIPSENELAATYQVGRPTVRQATDVLVRERRLSRRRGAGTFVIEPPREVDLFSLTGTAAAFRSQGLELVTAITEPLSLQHIPARPASSHESNSAARDEASGGAERGGHVSETPAESRSAALHAGLRTASARAEHHGSLRSERERLERERRGSERRTAERQGSERRAARGRNGGGPAEQGVAEHSPAEQGATEVGALNADSASEQAAFASSNNPFVGSEAFRFERVGSVGGEAVLLEVLYLHPGVFVGLDRFDLGGVSLAELSRDHYRLVPHSGRQTFKVVEVRGKKARALGFSAPTAVLLVERTLDFPGSDGALYTEMYCRTDRVGFSQMLGGLGG